MRRNVLAASWAVFMLLAFLFGNFGSFMLYDISQTQNRNDVNYQLHKNKTNLVALDITLSDLKDKNTFEQNRSDEIVYKGRLYDVVKKEVNKDGIVFYCINDTKEEALNVQLNEQVKTIFDQTTGKTTGKSTTSKNILSDYTPASLNLTYCNNISFTLYFSSQSEYISFYSEVLNPPPSLT